MDVRDRPKKLALSNDVGLDGFDNYAVQSKIEDEKHDVKHFIQRPLDLGKNNCCVTFDSNV